MATYHPSWKPSKLDEPDMWDTAGEVRANSLVMYYSGPLHTNEQVLDDQLEPIYNSSVPIQDVNKKTFQEPWTIETGGEGESGKSVLPTWHDDDIVFVTTTFQDLLIFVLILQNLNCILMMIDELEFEIY